VATTDPTLDLLRSVLDPDAMGEVQEARAANPHATWAEVLSTADLPPCTFPDALELATVTERAGRLAEQEVTRRSGAGIRP